MPPERQGFGASGVWAVLAAIGMLGWIAWDNRVEDTAPGRAPYDRLVGAQDDAESQALTGLVTDAFAVLRSPEFRANRRKKTAPGGPAAARRPGPTR